MNGIPECYIVRLQINFHQENRAKHEKLTWFKCFVRMTVSLESKTYSNVERRSKLCQTGVFYLIFARTL
jgi:hypothetical protein